MPMAAALCLLESNLTSLLYTARPVLLAFIIGAIGTVIGTLVAYRLVGGLLGGEGHKVRMCYLCEWVPYVYTCVCCTCLCVHLT